MNASFHPDANAEMLDAAQFYFEQRAGLEQAFIDEIERCITLIQHYPYT